MEWNEQQRSGGKKAAGKLGLVLEGGGLRGVYTAGVLDVLMKREIWADYVIGVSAGACSGASYVSRQPGRGYRVYADYIRNPRYLSLKNYWKTGSFFGMDFIFGEIPDHLDPFDYKTYGCNPCEFVVGLTDVETGLPAYFGKEDPSDACTLLRASSSMPVFSPPVEYRGGCYLDGGTSDPIPVEKALADGCDRLIVVLTRDRSYWKKSDGIPGAYRLLLRKYPAVARALDRRAGVYNRQRGKLWQMEREQKIPLVIIAPDSPITLGRFEKDPEKLLELYHMGRRDAENKGEELMALLG